MKKKLLTVSLLSILSFGVLAGFAANKSISYAERVLAEGYPHGDGGTYYDTIDSSSTGDSLKAALRSLNNTRKKASGGYSNLLKDKKWARYTDYDPTSTILTDKNGMPYSLTILSFYSGNKSNDGNGMNREHVWPDSRGGNLVEADTHMARPTLTKENSSRGNSFYVEGKCSTKDGWDPAAESWGDETYRGEAARIIFYCAMANTQLSLVEKENDDTGNKTMGKLSHLLKWNLQYSPLQREMNRNEAVEYIQGNRNPFIDHPEYACKIWGNASEEAKAVCAAAPIEKGVTISKSSIAIEEESSITISATSSDSSQITWSNNNPEAISLSSSSSASGANITINALSVGTATITASATIDGDVYTKTCSVTVSEKPVPVLDHLSLSGNYRTNFELNESFTSEGLVVTAHYTTGTSKVLSSDEYVLVAPDMTSIGNKSVKISYTEDGKTKEISYLISVSEHVEDVLDHITVSGGKREFTVNDPFSYEGLVVTAYYTVSNPKVVTPTSVSTPDMSTIGTKQVTVTYEENEIGKTAKYTIEVTNGDDPEVHVESVSLDKSSLELTIGEQYILQATVLPENAEDKTVSWSSSDTSVAKVSFLGRVTAMAEGSATITVTTNDGQLTATCEVKVIKPKPSGGGGCGGNVVTTSVILSSLALAGVVLIFIKRKFEK